MLKTPKVMAIFGVRPEAIKMAPLLLTLQKQSAIDTKVVVTAQHRRMLDRVLDVFGLVPDYDLDVMTEQQTLTDVSVRVLQRLEPVLRTERPDLVLVHGDTLTTFLASYAAFLQQIPVGHVEAGLRTGDKLSPYPEEMNRQMTGVLADLHFAPTPWAGQNLLRENKRPSTVFVTGNTVADVAAHLVTPHASHPLVSWAQGRRLLLLTAHRRESQGEGHAHVFRAVRRIVETFADVVVIYPVHPSPAVREPAYAMLGDHPRIRLVDPLDLVEMYQLYPHTHLILTDSGGLQEEAPSFGIPVLVLRETTERPEGIEAGVLALVGTDEAQVYARTAALLSDRALYARMSRIANPYGDGQASQRITQIIMHAFGLAEQLPLPFAPQ